MKQIFFALTWLLLTSGIIISAIASHQFIVHSSMNELKKQPKTSEQLADQERVELGQVAGLSTLVETKDARALLVTNFLQRHNSPMTPHDYYGQKLVEIADEAGIDFRLLPSIAMQESNLCKVVPEGTYNCLGLGIHSRGTWGFNSYEENFTAAARILKKNYIDKGLTTTELIEQKYNPTSANRDGSWAASVNQWMAEMRYDDRDSGREKKTDADLTEFTTSSQSAEPDRDQ